jgi:hypothetical protein
MHCHILVPGFGWHADEAAAVLDGLAAGALETLIARGRRVRAPALGAERWLLERFGVERQHDWPAAPLRLLADGGLPGAQAWLCADPVHLGFEQNRLVLADSTQFRLAPDEAEAFAASLNSHFGDVLTIHVHQPERWYARLDSCPEIETTPLGSARGRGVETLLPRGPEAMRWQALTNEIQMLLHGHMLNTAREARGELPVNSVWLWGGGRQPQCSARPFQFVAAADPLARGLAQACGAQSGGVAANAQAWLSEAGRTGVALVVLDALAAAADYGRADAWREALVRLESEWFAPLHAALKARRLGMLTLHFLGPEHTLDVEVTDADLRRFWRRRRPLAAWLA